jgi:hypothetical protein
MSHPINWIVKVVLAILGLALAVTLAVLAWKKFGPKKLAK